MRAKWIFAKTTLAVQHFFAKFLHPSRTRDIMEQLWERRKITLMLRF